MASEAPAGAPRADHFPLFDALRGIAALFVLIYHGLYQPATYAGVGEDWWRFAIHLDVAVPIFLCISGFLLYRPFVSARVRGRPLPSLTAYGVRRVLRIVPAYWVALTVLVLWFWHQQPPNLSEVRDDPWIFYGFLQIYGRETAIAGIGQAWTVDVEVTFYLVLPLWILFAWHRRLGLRAELLGLASLFALSIAWKVFMLSQTDPASRDSLVWVLPLPTWIDHFTVGMSLAVLSAHRWRPPLVMGRPALAWLAAAAFWLAACLIGPSGDPKDPVTDEIYLGRHLAYAGFVFFLALPAVFGDPEVGLVRRFLSMRAIAYVGMVSYSFYLFHFHVIGQQARWWGRGPETTLEWIPWVGGALAGSLILGTLGFYLVERPAMRLGGRYRRSPRPIPEPAP